MALHLKINTTKGASDGVPLLDKRWDELTDRDKEVLRMALLGGNNSRYDGNGGVR